MERVKAKAYRRQVAKAALSAAAATIALGMMWESGAFRAGAGTWLVLPACLAVVSLIAFRSGKKAANLDKTAIGGLPGPEAPEPRPARLEPPQTEAATLALADRLVPEPPADAGATGNGRRIAGSGEIYEVARQINEIADRLLEGIGSFKA